MKPLDQITILTNTYNTGLKQGHANQEAIIAQLLSVCKWAYNTFKLLDLPSANVKILMVALKEAIEKAEA